MNLKFKKIAKPIAIAVFFVALFLNLEVSLKNPYIRLNNTASAQTTVPGEETPEKTCYNTITTSEGHQVRYCPSCSFIDNSAASWVSSSGKC